VIPDIYGYDRELAGELLTLLTKEIAQKVEAKNDVSQQKSSFRRARSGRGGNCAQFAHFEACGDNRCFSSVGLLRETGLGSGK
jgi:hypothetical protein